MKTLIAIPCMDHVATGFVTSLLGLRRVGECNCAMTQSSLIYDARNTLAMSAIDNGFDRVLWLDSDMRFDGDMMERLAKDMDDSAECVCGLYFKRRLPTGPVIYKRVDIEQDDQQIKAIVEPYEDYPRNAPFEVKGMGFGAVMMNVDLLKRVTDKYGLPFSPMLGFGEDLTFCWRLQQLGVKMWCDSGVKVGHLGTIEYGEDMYTRQCEEA